MSYLNWDTKIITDFEPSEIEGMYSNGYVFTRVDRGVMNKTRSMRIKLSDFELSSENRRILRKVEHLKLETTSIPYDKYSWEIGKLAKDFYDAHDAEFSANKVKEILTDATKTNFNTLLVFSDLSATGNKPSTISSSVGYVICYESKKILHYSYPFYTPDPNNPSLGLGMMIRAIVHAKEKGLEYIYLGSLQRPSDTYKLQFKGMEWFDGTHPASTRADTSSTRGRWQSETESLKEILK